MSETRRFGDKLEVPGLAGFACYCDGWRRDNVIEPGRHRLIYAEIAGAKPAIWRRFLIRQDADLSYLHRVLQVLFGWESVEGPYHLHQFEFGALCFGAPEDLNGQGPAGEPQALDERWARIDALRPHETFTYRYDFGDDWLVTLRVEMSIGLDAEEGFPPVALCLGGERRGPPEDSGGIWTYNDKIRALSRKRLPRSLKAWAEAVQPATFDRAVINAVLAGLA